jgi:hypothetical protein
LLQGELQPGLICELRRGQPVHHRDFAGHLLVPVLGKDQYSSSEHDRDDPLGDCRVGWIGRMVGESPVEIIDLEKDRDAIDVERSEVVLFVWVVGLAEVVEDRDGLDDPV